MPDVVSLLWLGAAAAGVVEAARKALVNRGSGYALSRHFLTAGIACMALSLAAGAPVTLDWVDQLTGLHNTAVVAQNVLAMLAMVFTAGFLHTLGQLRLPMPAVVTIFVVCAAAMVILYTLAGARTSFFASPWNPTWPSQLYSAIYLGYLVGWLAMLLLGLTVVARGEVAGVRGGVAFAQLGVAVSLVGLSWRLGVAIRLLVDPHHPPRGTHFGVFTDSAGLVLFVAGSLFAAATRRLFDWLDRRRTQRRDAAIERLWKRLRVLLASRCPPPLSLIQKLVEIEDALLIVEQLVDERIRRATRNELRALALYVYVPPGTATAVDIEIALDTIVAHLSHPSAGHLPGSGCDDADSPAWWPETERLHVDEAARIRWLAEVGDALTHRRVQRMAARISATHRRLQEAGSPSR